MPFLLASSSGSDSLLQELENSRNQLSLSYHHYREDRSIGTFDESAQGVLLIAQSTVSIWQRVFVLQNRALRLENVCMLLFERNLREIGVRLATAALSACWTLPSTLVGFLSQPSVLPLHVIWLSWLNPIPIWLLGTIQSRLP